MGFFQKEISQYVLYHHELSQKRMPGLWWFFFIFGKPHFPHCFIHLICRNVVMIIDTYSANSLFFMISAVQLRQPMEESLVLCQSNTLQLYTVHFSFDLHRYLTKLSRVKWTYWVWSILSKCDDHVILVNNFTVLRSHLIFDIARA